jgi:hypothetical protein
VKTICFDSQSVKIDCSIIISIRFIIILILILILILYIILDCRWVSFSRTRVEIKIKISACMRNFKKFDLKNFGRLSKKTWSKKKTCYSTLFDATRRYSTLFDATRLFDLESAVFREKSRENRLIHVLYKSVASKRWQKALLRRLLSMILIIKLNFE